VESVSPVSTARLCPRELPRYRTSLVGRDEELQLLVEVVVAGGAVTLTGVGGTGKTRLAVELAQRVAAAWPDGVVFVDLASVREDRLAWTAALVALGVSAESARSPRETVVRSIRGRRLLLVLDNCEHVVAGAVDVVGAVFDAAPASSVLTTSRERLRVAGERVWPVPPLDAAGPDSAAVDLLVQRGRAAYPQFRRDDDVVALAGRVGGLPLAIEMIAPWTRSLSAAEITARVDHLLALGEPSLPVRQRTMTAVLAWSERLLDSSARALFHRLAVFVGGFDLEAAEAVAGDDGEARCGVLPVLARLVDSSMVLATPHSAVTRYGLLEPVRQFALGRLGDEGDEHLVRDRHLGHFLRLAATIGRNANGADAPRWLARADVETPNLRAAFDWAVSRGRSDDAASLAANLYWYWWIRTATGEGIDRLTRALALEPTPAAAAPARIGLAHLLLRADRRSEATAATHAALVDARAVGDRRLEALALSMAGRLANDRRDLLEAEAMLDGAERIYKQLGSERGIASTALLRNTTMMLRGDIAGALREADRAEAIFRVIGGAWGLSWTKALRGFVAASQGELSVATALIEAAIRIAEEGGSSDAEFTSIATMHLAAVYARSGRHEEGRRLLDRSLAYSDRFPSETGAGMWCWVLAEAAAARGAHELVMRALGAVDTYLGAAEWKADMVHAPGRCRLLRDNAEAALGHVRAAELDRLGGAEADRRALLEALDQARVDGSASPPGRSVAVWRREGRLWEAGWAGATAHVADRKGMRGVAALLARPGVEVHALELAGFIEGTPTAPVASTSVGPLLDQRAKAAYRDRIIELRAEIDEADANHDGGRVEQARIELDALTSQLSAAFGLGGRARQFGSAAERARVNVTRVIRDAIARVAEHDPEFGHLLATSIDTGTFCCYRPPPSGGPTWEL
jgi:predicted ATPase